MQTKEKNKQACSVFLCVCVCPRSLAIKQNFNISKVVFLYLTNGSKKKFTLIKKFELNLKRVMT